MKKSTLKSFVALLWQSIIRVFTFPPFLIYLAAFGAILAQLFIFGSMVREVNPWMRIDKLQVVADVAVVLVPFMLLRPKWRWAVWIPIVCITIFCYVNLWYCRAFYDLMPLESAGMGGNMQDRVIDAFLVQVHAKDWWLLLPTLCFAVAVVFLRGRWRKTKFPAWVKIAFTAGAVLLYGGAYLSRCHAYHVANRPKEAFSDTVVRYFELSKGKSYKFCQHVSRMGYIGYWLWQVDDTFISKKLTKEDRKRIDDFWTRQRERQSPLAEYSGNKGRNLVLLIVESLAADGVGMTVNGVEVTPHIDSLIANDPTAIVMRHVVAQVSHGRSSDGQFIYNTGLLPLRNSVVTKRHPAANYPSLAKALDYPSKFEVIGEKPTFYNHSTTNLSYGYDHLYPTNKNKWLNDSEILERALGLIRQSAQPFFCEITTLTMHDPYNKKIESPTPISEAEGYDDRDLNYLEQLHVFDARLGAFVQGLKKSGLYDNTVFIIVSDHEPRKNCLSENLISSDIFFLALNTGAPGMEIDRIIGQIDVFPAMLEIMGVNTYRYPGVGVSPLTNRAHHGAADALGNKYDNPDKSTMSHIEEAWDVSALMVEGGYFN